MYRTLFTAALLISNIFFAQASFSESLKLTTFNVGLAYDFVSFAKERKAPIINHLKNDDSDLLCLQEVWRKQDRNDIVSELLEQFPYSYQKNGVQEFSKAAPTCSISRLVKKEGYLGCIIGNCLISNEHKRNTCVINDCRESLVQLNKEAPECSQAIMSLVGKNIAKGILDIVNPFQAAGVFAYEGENGLLLLSKKPFTQVEFLDMSSSSTLTKRGAIKATFESNNKEHHVVCTHLGANLEKLIPYLGDNTSWREENRKHLLELSDLLPQAKNSNDPIYVLGDMNCGLNYPDKKIQGDFSANCGTLIDAGFKDPVPEKILPQEKIVDIEIDKIPCSFCADNLLIKEHNVPQKNLLIDHIYIKNAEILDSYISYDQSLNIKVDGVSREVHLSDHFGITTIVKH